MLTTDTSAGIYLISDLMNLLPTTESLLPSIGHTCWDSSSLNI